MMRFKELLQSKVKRAGALILAATMVTTNVSLLHTKEAYAASFQMGTANHWAEPYMRNLYNRGLMSGDKNGNMNPNQPITRAEFISIVNRTFGYSKTGKTPFKDIKGTEWYADDISIAYNQGYFSGDGKATANAQGRLTREQAIALLGRNLAIEETAGVSSSFADSTSIANWSRGYVNTSADKGFISGYKDGSFKPQNNITRAEVAKVLTDAVGELVKRTGTVSLGTQEGNVTIAANGVTLKDTVIKGDLYIAGGVGLGSTLFDNVHVLGEVIINGTGESQAGKSSITFKDSTISSLIIPDTGGTIKSVKLTGNTIVDKTTVKTNTYLEETASRGGGFKDVVLNGAPKTELHLAGLFDTVTVMGPQNNLYVDKETVQSLIVDEEAVGSKVFLDSDTYVNGAYLDVGVDVSGTGEIGYLKVNAAGSKVVMLPEEVEVRPGLTADVNGKKMTSKDADEATDKPQILSDYPEIEDIGPTDAVAKFKVNKPGTLYWAITTYDDGRTSSDETIKPGKYNTEIKKNGSLKVESGKEFSVKITGLEMNTEYALTAVLVDDREDRSGRGVEYFETTDNSKPGFLSGYPRIKEVTSVSAAIEYIPVKDGDLYWAVYEKGYPAPDTKALKSQKLYSVYKNGVERSVKKLEGDVLSITGLKELSGYDVYILISDGSNDSSVVKMQLNTPDATPPQFNLGYPKLTASDRTSAEISVSLNEEGLVYYAIYEGGTDFPVKEQVDAPKPAITSNDAKQQIIKGKGALKTGKSPSLKGDITGVIKMTGLKPESEYDVYLVAEDKSGNLSEIKKINIGAKPDFIAGYPRVHSIQGGTVEIAMNVTKDSSAHWAILPKGSIAPTAVNLKNQTVPGATQKGILKDCEKNVERLLKIEGLKEFTDYEFYVYVTDSFTDSAISKLAVKTADLTPPVFANGYPVTDKKTDKSIDIKFKVNEAANIYYVLCKRGETFPLLSDPDEKDPNVILEETKRQVVLGNSGLKNGKVSAKQNVEGKFSITGLTPETSYDLYIVAVDNFNNITLALPAPMEVGTLDVTPPKALLEFEETISGDVVAGSEIRIVFSEEVWDKAAKVKLSQMKPDDWAKSIKLYDLSTMRRPLVPIDFTKAKVEDVEGKTIVTFPKDSLPLNSGNAYEFELNGIMDAAYNKMDEKTLLPSFHTVAPMVEIIKTIPPSNKDLTLDMTFELTPQVSETNDNIFFDIVFKSSEKVGFEIYEKKEGDAEFTLIQEGGKSRVLVEKDKSVSLQNIKDKILQSKDAYGYETFKETFKDGKKIEYGIKILSINGDEKRKGWSSTVGFDVKCIIGSRSGLTPVSDNPTEQFQRALNDGEITVVNYPKDFNVKIYFTDSIVPQFAENYPKLYNDATTGVQLIGDTLIRPIVKTDRPATFYYLVVKSGTVTDPTPDAIMEGKYKPQDGVTGKVVIPSGDAEYQLRIEGLKPQGEYTMYCFLKGTPAETSEMKEISPIKMTDVDSPKFTKYYVKSRDKDYALIDIELDKEAEVDWVAYNVGAEPKPVKAEDIKNKQQMAETNPVDFGGPIKVTMVKGENTAKATIRIDGLKHNVYYNFYAIAKGLAGGEDSEIIHIDNITPVDRTAPTVNVSTGNLVETSGGVYSGTVTLTFIKPMYYIPKEGESFQPLPVSIIAEAIKKDPEDESKEQYRLNADRQEVPVPGEGNKKAVIRAGINFSGVSIGSTIFIPYVLADGNANVAGRLYLQFVAGKDGAGPSWEATFVA